MSADNTETKSRPAELPTCFIIMPIADRPNYVAGHFGKVYRVIIEPAVRDAGYNPYLASLSTETVVIQLQIISQFLNAPMALCDISDLNANVMYELGVRQAFDKPAVMLKDDKTTNPFDISSLRYRLYSSGLSYETVVEERSKITAAIISTAKGSEDSVNSLVRLLGIQAAALGKSISETDATQLHMQILSDQILKMMRSVYRMEERLIKQEKWNELSQNWLGGLMGALDTTVAPAGRDLSPLLNLGMGLPPPPPEE